MEIPTIADFNRLESELSEVKALLSLYADKAALAKVVTVADIARMEGVSKSQLYQPPGHFFPGRYTGSPATPTAGAEQVAGGAHIPAGSVQIGARLYPADGRETKVRDNRKG